MGRGFSLANFPLQVSNRNLVYALLSTGIVCPLAVVDIHRELTSETAVITKAAAKMRNVERWGIAL